MICTIKIIGGLLLTFTGVGTIEGDPDSFALGIGLSMIGIMVLYSGVNHMKVEGTEEVCK